jgi:hypothetical protein
MRLLERTAQSSPAGHPTADAEAVIVRVISDPAQCVNVLAGRSDPPGVEMLIVGNFSTDSEAGLRAFVGDALGSAAFMTFSLLFSFDLVAPATIDNELSLRWPVGNEPQLLFEFDLSRHGAFTQRPTVGLFPSLPRMLTTIELGAPLHPTTLSPLEQARTEGEKKLLQTLITSGLGVEKIAEQLRLPKVELDQLLRKHGLTANALAFAVALPEDLLEQAENLEG